MGARDTKGTFFTCNLHKEIDHFWPAVQKTFWRKGSVWEPWAFGLSSHTCINIVTLLYSNAACLGVDGHDPEVIHGFGPRCPGRVVVKDMIIRDTIPKVF